MKISRGNGNTRRKPAPVALSPPESRKPIDKNLGGTQTKR
jgi:hypothetical protein